MEKPKTLEKLLRSGNSFRNFCLSALVVGGLAIGVAGCEEYDYKQAGDSGVYSRDTPWAELISPINGAPTHLNATFSWRIVNVKSGETYHAELRTDKGVDPLDDWYEDSFDGGTVTATEGTGIAKYYDNSWHPSASIEMSKTVSLDGNRYYGQGFEWGIKLTSGSEVCSGDTSWTIGQ